MGPALRGCPCNLRLQTFSMDGVMDGGYELMVGVVWRGFGGDLSALEEKYCDLAKVEVDEMSGLMSDVGTKVPANNAVPCGVVLFVKLLLDVSCNVLLNVVLLQGLGGAVDSVLLHLLGHVRILDHCLPVRHLEA